MPVIGTILEAITLLTYTLEHNNVFRRNLIKLRYWLRRGVLNAMVFGAGGTGKTTLGLFLIGKLPSDGEYKQSMDEEKREIENLVMSLKLLPGQNALESRWTHTLNLFVAGKIRGVINVVSWGYHSSDLKMSQLSGFESWMTPAEFLEPYLASKREHELELTKHLVDKLSATEAKPGTWMITLVLKQDLWWDRREEVRRHYEEGAYSQLIKGLTDSLGSKNFTHYYLYASLFIGNLVVDEELILAKNTSGYGQALQFEYLEKLVGVMTSRAVRNRDGEL